MALEMVREAYKRLVKETMYVIQSGNCVRH